MEYSAVRLPGELMTDLRKRREVRRHLRGELGTQNVRFLKPAVIDYFDYVIVAVKNDEC